ncbi:MAG: hypothetical protein U0637_11020 [Phycisphaerales bacterium]
MNEKRVLPEPAFVQHAPFCLRCAYSLEGLRPPNACPECGLRFDEGQLIFVGVPRDTAKHTPVHRRVVWVALFVLGAGLWLLSGLLIVRYPWVALAWFAAVAGCVVYLATTSQRERSAYERFAVTDSGIARMPIRIRQGEVNIDTVFVPWGDAGSFVIQRVGPFWKRLQVGTQNSKGKIVQPVFDAGFRCADEHAALVRDALERAMRRYRGEAVEGVGLAAAPVPEFLLLGTEFLRSLPTLPRFTARMVFNRAGAIVFPANQQHRDQKAVGISYEDGSVGNAMAAELEPGRIDIRYHQDFQDAEVAGILGRVVRMPDFAVFRDAEVTYGGRVLRVERGS